jgi:glycine betaine/proline transport system permease protein/glycine betaine/proline transport system substrate-binding protein
MCGLWENMLETISMVIVAVFLSVIIGFPLGIIVAMSKRISAVVRPVLDLMQTMPAFVYLVPAVILFSPGKTPALIATTIYAVVPMVRMTNLGIVHVDKEMVEAASAFGSTKMQLLSKVQIPQAMPAIMAGLNQTIMMAMSMVVTCALIGANGLGMEILLATNRTEMGKALMPGISIVIVAIILDRLTQGLIKKEASTE